MSRSGTNSRGGAWTLEVPSDASEAADVQMPDDGRKATTESIIGEDKRTLVPTADIQDGGQYRCKSSLTGLPGTIVALTLMNQSNRQNPCTLL
jgi:hypothetical protein